ncbi:MAG: hypothetical protein EXR99_04410 [Gemmataceae bacterium]|nr:hypothetical protein [Gemmataceae bacterium]
MSHGPPCRGKLQPGLRFFLIAFLVFLLSLAGVFLLNQFGKKVPALHPSSTSQNLVFSQIDCSIPSGLTKEGFLEEVQYLGKLPAEMDLSLQEKRDILKNAFSLHPWVEKVSSISAPREGRALVQLVFRKPAMRIRLLGDSRLDTLRVVDSAGVMLPASAPKEGLPEFFRLLDNSLIIPGKPIEQADVVVSARLASLLQNEKWISFPPIVGLDNKQLFFQSPDGAKRIIWGSEPGKEIGPEPQVANKLERLKLLMKNIDPGKEFRLDLSKS